MRACLLVAAGPPFGADAALRHCHAHGTLCWCQVLIMQQFRPYTVATPWASMQREGLCLSCVLSRSCPAPVLRLHFAQCAGLLHQQVAEPIMLSQHCLEAVLLLSSGAVLRQCAGLLHQQMRFLTCTVLRLSCSWIEAVLGRCVSDKCIR